MKKHANKLMMTLLFGMFAGMAWASNVQITQKPELTNEGANHKIVSFGLSWDYSWRTVDPNNWDAVWVFVKYRVGSLAWDHMYLDGSYTPVIDNTNGVAMSYSYGKTDDGTKNVGVFMYRSGTGSGSIEWEGVKLRWKYNDAAAYLGTNTVLASDEITVKVFAIEMVYVPDGAFYLGSGGTLTGEFCRADRVNGVSEPYYVNSEAAMSVRARPANQAALDAAILAGTAEGLSTIANNYAVNSATSVGPVDVGTTPAIPATYPKGYKAFYCMKYEISQGAYVDFLNTLTVVQQQARTRVAPNSAAGTRAMQQTDANDRNYIKILKSGVAEYGCDMNNNGVLNEDADGQNVPCAMNQQDFMGYLDFCGLRPMTEFEYEKACRGTRSPVPYEFAWGSTYVHASAVSSGANVAAVPASGTARGSTAFAAGTYGTPEERPAVAGVNMLTHATTLNAQSILIRNGAFANDTSGRVVSGATYWGIMEMSGNMWEYAINCANAVARAYTGKHGDGRLQVGGTQDVEAWPDYVGFGIRGGSTVAAVISNLSTTPNAGSNHSVSFRGNAWWNSNVGNSYNVGGRGVRTVVID